MKTSLYMLAGAVVTLSGAMAAGQLLLHALRIGLSRMEQRLFALVVGAGCWSAMVCLLAWMHLARKGVFVALAALLIVAAFLVRRKYSEPPTMPGLNAGMRWLFRVLFAFFLVLYFVYAAAPESGLFGNHLGRVKQVWEARGFPHAVAGITQPRQSAIEFPYLTAFSIGRHCSAALVHLALLAALALGMASYARRRGYGNAGAFAALMVFMSPLAGVDATMARTEAALACVLFFCYYAIELWSESRQRRMLIVAGALLVFAIAVGVSPSTGSVVQQADRPAMLLGNAIGWTVLGSTGQGFLGPVFMLAPLGLLALRLRTGRKLWLAAALSALWLIGSARLESALPIAVFVSLAMGLALMNSPGMLPLLVVAHAVLSLPQVAGTYSWPDSWRLQEWPLRAALRRLNEDAYLSARMFPAYGWARSIEQAAAKNELVFALAEPARAYCAARVIVAAESSGGRALHEMLETPLRTGLQAGEALRLSFSPQTADALRLVAEASSSTPLRIHELRLWQGEREVVREEGWRLRASVNPERAGDAFDNSYVTRWSTVTPAAQGDFIEVEFGSDKTIDAVTLEWPAGQSAESLEVWLSDGRHWLKTPVRMSRSPIAERRGIRLAAIFRLKQLGFRMLFVPNADPCAKDLSENSLVWRVTPVREAHEAIIYRLD